MAGIRLENVTKVFEGKVAAVSGLNLDVSDGQFMVIVGPSGCGKTTTLRLIAGLEKATSGNIYIDSTPVNDLPPKDRDVAMVFQNYALYPHMTAFENMAFSLKMCKLPKAQIQESVEKAAKLLGIEDLLGRKPKTLSGGQRQRIALGKAVVRNPRVFLFDEPLSNLDAGLRLNMRAEIKALHQKMRITTIYVTHDQVEAMTLGEKICVLHKGMIQQIAGPMEIYERPKNRFVAGFFGTPPMNFFTGKFKFENNSAFFRTACYTLVLPQHLKIKLDAYCDKETVLGVRPENISFAQLPGQKNNEITGKVSVIEPVGNKTDIYISNPAGEKFIVISSAYTNLKVNDAVTVYIDMEKIHIFEPGWNGNNVTLNSKEK